MQISSKVSTGVSDYRDCNFVKERSGDVVYPSNSHRLQVLLWYDVQHQASLQAVQSLDGGGRRAVQQVIISLSIKKPDRESS